MLPKKNLVLASQFSGIYDVNRNETLIHDDFSLIKDWADSLKKLELQGVIFHNGFSKATISKYQNAYLKFAKISYNPNFNPNVFRYFVYNNYLNENRENINSVFLTDVADVVAIKNPFIQPFFINNSQAIFCGDEPKPLLNDWMLEHSAHFRKTIPNFTQYEEKFKNASLLNCGIIGGKTKVMLEFLKHVCEVNEKYNQGNTRAYTGDMGAFNYIIRTYFNSRIIHGFPVNTVFKEYQVDRKDCWFRHK
jgi:hypothetical protein